MYTGRRTFIHTVLCISACASAVASAASIGGTVNSIAGTSPLSRERLASAAANGENLYSHLDSFVCREQVERYRGVLHGTVGRHLETITAKLSFSGGIESYSELTRKTDPFSDLTELEGAWSTGEFGTLLKQTQHLLRTQDSTFEGYETIDGRAAALYSFGVDARESSWDLKVERRHYSLAFRTDVWVARETGAILKIRRRSTGVPSEGISSVEWAITLKRFALAGEQWLLPGSGEYSVGYSNGRGREWNRMKFSDYRRQ